MRSQVLPLVQGPLLLAPPMVTLLDPPPMEHHLEASIIQVPQVQVTHSTGLLLDIPSTGPRLEVTTMDLHPQEPRDTPRALGQLQVPLLAMLRHTQVPMVHQAPVLRDLRPTELWVTRPRDPHQVLHNLVQEGRQVAPLQVPQEVLQEARLPPVPPTILADQELTTSRSWRTLFLKWRRRGCRETQDIMRPGGCISLSRQALKAPVAIPRQEHPLAPPLASVRVN